MTTLKLEFVKTVKTRGKEYLYFNTGEKTKDGNAIYKRLPDPSSAKFFSTYGALKAVRTKRENRAALMTIERLSELYEASSEFDHWRNGKLVEGRLSKETQRIYSQTLVKVRAQFQNKRQKQSLPVEALEKHHIVYYMDTHADKPGAANTFMDTVKSMYAWANDRGHTKKEPARGIKKLKTGEHEPWPEALVERGLSLPRGKEPLDDRIRLAIHLLYFTGQRISDIVKIQWNHIEDGFIYVKQKKTGKELWIPIHSRLQAELDKTPRIGFNVLGRYTGAPIGPQPIRIAIKNFTDNKYVPHGLAKNAINALLECGCSEAQVMGFTGKSAQMVAHYSKKRNQKKLGSAAVLKWERKG